jgi:DNA modification methylase
MATHWQPGTADLVFSCPPYADLEVYSDDAHDLSNMPHDEFFAVFARCLAATYTVLKDNRFAVITIGEVRSKAGNGNYISLVPKTIEIMRDAGFAYYNELILINSAGTLPLRAGKSMLASRKIGKQHQNVLVFVKGSPQHAAHDFGNVIGNLEFDPAADDGD